MKSRHFGRTINDRYAEVVDAGINQRLDDDLIPDAVDVALRDADFQFSVFHKNCISLCHVPSWKAEMAICINAK